MVKTNINEQEGGGGEREREKEGILNASLLNSHLCNVYFHYLLLS